MKSPEKASRVGVPLPLLGMLCLFGCARHEQSDTRFENFGTLAAGIKGSSKVVLYEGLPHQNLAKSLHDEEIKTKKTVTFHSYPFYEVPLGLRDGDDRKLTDL